MNIVILAAGQGKRMRSELPKVLHPVAGRAMLSHVLDAATGLPPPADLPAKVIVVVGHGAERVRSALSDRPDVHWVLQQQQLGTGHAVSQAAGLLDDRVPTLILYGDVPLIRTSTLQSLVLEAESGVRLLTVELADPSGYGRIVRNADGKVERIVEHKDATETQRSIREINTGILAAPTPALKRWLSALKADNAQGEYYLTDTVAMAVQAGVPVRAVRCTDTEEVLGVNDKEQLAQAERVAQRRIAQRLMADGVQLADPARIDVRGDLTAGADVFIDVGCVFEGRVSLGDGVRIGPHTVMRDCDIGAGTEVLGFCFLESAVVGAQARIGPFARTRPQVRLADGVHIGNFVEVKNAQMGADSKANHLAYVGDATVGARVNIGAGTIVANYDGANKHRTLIGDDVHTGSNSVLVAPIKVGDGATVGAGSTVTREVPAGQLTVARAKQVDIPGWKRPVKKKAGQ
jgi:bifunctional UDP-N-acetylglucosamine pyrophosphorylase/glucosamine-1-phosphate N-acetyltransferase